MKRLATLAYAVVCYGLFFATFLYAIGFLANVGVPKSIDSVPAATTAFALIVNLALLGVFAVQHSVMARPSFKRLWTRIVPRPVERATYVLASSLALALLFWGWQPLEGSLFTVTNETGRLVLRAVFFGGVGLVLYSTFLIDHFDLFGLRQAFLYVRGVDYTEKRFMTPSLYRHIRHPLYVGWFITFWATPDMTFSHLLMAGVVTAYILVAIVFEERDLLAVLGPEYAGWRARTPKFLPLRRRVERPASAAREATA
ncbi:MAG: isoprenylcysteine carboxylmethyltransferase family protein [Myxococcota bacterium]